MRSLVLVCRNKSDSMHLAGPRICLHAHDAVHPKVKRERERVDAFSYCNVPSTGSTCRHGQ